MLGQLKKRRREVSDVQKSGLEHRNVTPICNPLQKM